MPNSIKGNGEGGLALQVTKAARSAELVEEDNDGEANRLARVRVYAFDYVLLVVDRDRVDDKHVAELVRAAAGDTESIHRATDAAVSIAGNGYQVQLPVATDAGLEIDGEVPCQPAPGLLVIHRKNRDQARLAEDLLTIRRAQKEQS